MRVEDKAATK